MFVWKTKEYLWTFRETIKMIKVFYWLFIIYIIILIIVKSKDII